MCLAMSKCRQLFLGALSLKLKFAGLDEGQRSGPPPGWRRQGASEKEGAT